MPIIVLKPHIANQIAAGEVVERPASIVKELIENALDAGAKHIHIEVENGGLDFIRVSDDGCGMSFEDALTCFERHATSKIREADDLTHIQTYGFRGEALPSIAAVSSVELKTKRPEDETGTLVKIASGTVQKHVPIACNNGTVIEIRELFAYIPARLKFLKSPRTEAGYIGDYIARSLLAAPQIAFTYTHNGRTVYRSVGDGSLENALYAVYGADIAKHILPLKFDDGYLSIGGFIGDAEISKPNRTYQTFLINGRYIRSNALSAALMRAYESRLMSGRFPFAVIDMRISGYEVDVNVHPAKLEVRFTDEQRVIRSLTAAAHRALLAGEGASLEEPETVSASSSDSRDAFSFHQLPNGSETGFTRVDGYTRSDTRFGLSERRSFGGYRSYSGDKDYAVRESHQARYRFAGQISQRNTDSTEGHDAADIYKGAQANGLPEALPVFTVPEAARTLGCAFETYWILESGDELLFIDQHAAHERIVYEKLILRREEGGRISQTLLLPLEVSLTESEKATAEEYQAVLSDIGASFKIDDADGKLYLTEMPVLYGRTLDEGFFRHALQICAETGTVTAKELLKEKLSQCACKHAVKAGDPLTEEEVAALLNIYQTEGIPMTCPHGRPVMICLKKRELEKLFKRVL